MADLREVLVQSVLILLLIGSVAGFVIGLALLVRSEPTLLFFRRVNRWVATGIDIKAREERPVAGSTAMTPTQRRVAGSVFTIAGGFSAAVLASMPAIPAAALLQARGPVWAFSLLLSDFLRWFLAVGCTGAAIVGILLVFFPETWTRVEAWANRWHSTQRLFADGDVMHMPLDRWIERAPRPAGALITVLSVVAVVAFATLLHLHK